MEINLIFHNNYYYFYLLFLFLFIVIKIIFLPFLLFDKNFIKNKKKLYKYSRIEFHWRGMNNE